MSSNYGSKHNIITVNETISNKNIIFSFNKQKSLIYDTNFLLNEEYDHFLRMYLPIIFSDRINFIFGHIAQSLDGYIATELGESKYISGNDNLKHIHRLRALSDIIIVGAKTFIEDKPKLTTRLVKGTNPKIFIFDPKNIIKKRPKNISIIKDKDQIKSEIFSKKEKIKIYVEGGGKTLSFFLKHNLMNRLHLCICPIILGGGRSSFYSNKFIELSKLKEYSVNYYPMGTDILCDLDIS